MERSNEVEELLSVYSEIDLTKFISIIFDVPLQSIVNISNIHYESNFNGGLFISDKKISAPNFQPSYFTTLVNLVNQNKIDISETCGCAEINECVTSTNNCPGNSECVNTDGDFECYCNKGYHMEIKANDAILCSDVNECDENVAECHENSECVNTDGAYKCQCFTGYTGDGFSTGSGCNDRDECNLQIDNCVEMASCHNTVGSFLCKCPDGFAGNGGDEGCVDIDECLKHPCQLDASCRNTIGGFECECDLGFKEVDIGNGILECHDVNECTFETDKCHIMADCENTIGSYACTCKEGWNGDGLTCSEDICSLCDFDASCFDNACHCPVGLSGSGFQCRNFKTPIILRKQPRIENDVCVDPYVKLILEYKNVLVILMFPDKIWQPCLLLLHQHKIKVNLHVESNKVNFFGCDRFDF